MSATGTAAMGDGYLGPRFDAAWYAARYRRRVGARAPLDHYLAAGRVAGCKPNALILADVTPRDPLAFTLTDLENERELIEDAGIFDHDWYAYVHGIPAADTLHHYLTEGAYQGLDPSPFFSTENYYRDYPEIAAAGTNALWHFVLFGFTAQRDGAPAVRAAARLAFDETIWRFGFASPASVRRD